jgi:hypothetical protein
MTRQVQPFQPHRGAVGLGAGHERLRHAQRDGPADAWGLRLRLPDGEGGRDTKTMFNQLEIVLAGIKCSRGLLSHIALPFLGGSACHYLTARFREGGRHSDDRREFPILPDAMPSLVAFSVGHLQESSEGTKVEKSHSTPRMALYSTFGSISTLECEPVRTRHVDARLGSGRIQRGGYGCGLPSKRICKFDSDSHNNPSAASLI